MTLLTLAVLVTDSRGQTPDSPKRGRSRTTGDAQAIEFVVDGVKQHTWSPEELSGLATAKWTNPRGKEMPAIPLAALLKDRGVLADSVSELRIGAEKKVVTFKGEDLAKAERLGLRRGNKQGWQLVSFQPAAGRRRGQLEDVRRVEVLTAK